MKNFKILFLELLRDISEATRRREESEADYQHLLRNIFKEGGQHDASQWEAPSGPWFSCDCLLRMILKKGGPRDTTHANPEVDSEVDVEHLQIPKVWGREQEMRKLLLKCCNPVEEGIQLSVIPIFGATGIGKTALARVLYEDEQVLKHFEVRAWVKVDEQEFTLHHAAQQILKSTTMGMPYSIDDLDELEEMVRDTLQWRRCLIVFDGVESITQDVWLHMNKNWFAFVGVGSKVLITTPSEGVATLVSNEAFELKQLLPDDGWSLYRYLAVGSSQMVEDTLTSRYLVALCGCIPLLLKLVGSMMRYDDKLRHLLLKVRFSDAVSLPTFDSSVVILFCVWALPPQLRQCLAFCATFPKGNALDREKIIKMWIAHGLVKPSRKENLYDIGYSYFRQLLCRSFFTDIARNESGDITEFQMPGLIHTMMQDVAGIIWEGKVGVIGSISQDSDMLSMHSERLEDVRTLIFSSALYSGARSLNYTFLYFWELESLDLSCSGIRSLSDDICALRELKYLNLSYTFIERLPDSITGLPRLETLDLSGCYHFKVLPKVIRNLTCTSHLDLSQCESLSYLPSGIGFLVSLTSMPLFVLGKDRDSACLGELRQLNQLRGRLEIRNLENVLEISEARDAELNQKKLHHLGLCWSEKIGDCFEVLELLEPNRQLKFLDLTGYMSLCFPRWFSSMSSLIKISITDCRCKELPPLGQLPLLKELQLNGMANIRHIGPEFYGDGVSNAFPSLEQLGLYDMPILLEWSGAGAWGSGEVCRSLKTLTIEGCPWLSYIPTFRNLLDLIVCNCSVEFLQFLNGTTFCSLSSLLIKNMELGYFLGNSTGLSSLKKLIFFNSTWYMDNAYLEMLKFAELEHLGILHCHQVDLKILSSGNPIQQLHLVNCPNLKSIYFSQEATNLTKLVVDGCPELYSLNSISKVGKVTKLIIRGSDKFLGARDFKELDKLQYLYISECPLLEKELETDPSPISHIPCVLLGNHKVGYHYQHRNDFDEDVKSALFELKHDSLQDSTFKGSSEWPSIHELKQPLSTHQPDSQQFHVSE